MDKIQFWMLFGSFMGMVIFCLLGWVILVFPCLAIFFLVLPGAIEDSSATSLLPSPAVAEED